MDYHKTYNKAYKNSRLKMENFIKIELQKGLESDYTFETVFEYISNNLYQIKNKYKKALILKNFKEAIDQFDTWKEKYAPNKSTELAVKNELQTFYNSQVEKTNLDIDFTQILLLFSEFRAADDTIESFYDRKIHVQTAFEADMVKNFTLEPNESNWENTPEYTRLYNRLNLISKKSSHLESEKESLWKERISQFTDDEIILLLSIYYNKRNIIKRPEFLKLIMISGSLFDISLFEGDYKNKKIYKYFSEGANYHNDDKPEYLLDFLTNLSKKTLPFNMQILNGALESLKRVAVKKATEN